MRAGELLHVRWGRTLLLGLLVGVAGVVAAPVAQTAPVAQAAPVRYLAGLPAGLQKYVPGSAAWQSSPWMTSPTCRGSGADFSVWAATVIADTPQLLAFFQASSFGPEVAAQDRPRSEAILAGYRALASGTGMAVPSGYCVDDLRRWAGADPAMRPFGFPWGVTVGDGHRSGYFCTDREPGTPAEAELNRWFGAERAMCDGFYVRCANAQEVEKSRCEAWNAFSDSYIRGVEQLRSRAIAEYPASGQAQTHTRLRTPEEMLQDVAGDWFQEMTVNILQAATSVMAEAMTFWTRTDHSSLVSSPAIATVHRLLRYVGIVVLIGSMMWQAMVMMYRRKLDPLVGTATGLLSFAGWSTLAGSLAVLLDSAGVALADQVFAETSGKFSTTMAMALQANVETAPGAVFFLSIIVFFLACVQWVLGFFRMGAVVILLGLVPMAAAGQLNESTKPWLRKVLSWCLSLILYKPIAAIVFAIGFTLMSEGTTLSTVLVGMAVLALAVVAMPTMLRFFDWGGQRLVGSGGGGGAMAVGAAASVLGGGGAAGVGRMMDHSGPAGGRAGGRSSGAVPVSSSHAGDGPDRAASGGTDAAHGGGSSPRHAAAPGGPASGGGNLTSATASSAGGAPGTSGSAGAATAGATGSAAVVAAQVAMDGAGRATGALVEGVGDGSS